MNLKYFGLRKEAFLLDSHLYIIKAMVALAFAYTLSMHLPLIGIDKVSILLGVMYNLEAANVLGLRGGLNQLLASSLGAFVSGLLIVVMNYQVGVLTIVLGMGLTMWIALKIDYRMVSPVAIFTSLYMNLLLQNNAMGVPSVATTFIVRLLALGFGIGVAIMFNALFSLVYYKTLAQRRLEHVKLQTLIGLRHTLNLLQSTKNAQNNLDALVGLFNDIETVKAHLDSLSEERFWLSATLKNHLPTIQALVLEFKNMLHLAYDLLYLQQFEQHIIQADQSRAFEDIIASLEALDFTQIQGFKTLNESSGHLHADNRFDDSIARLRMHHQHILDHIIT